MEVSSQCFVFNLYFDMLPQIPEEEKNLGPHDRLIHVYHFMKDTTQNQVVSAVTCSPYWFFCIILFPCCGCRLLFMFRWSNYLFFCYILFNPLFYHLTAGAEFWRTVFPGHSRG